VDPISLGRLMEGIRLYNACPDCTLILSGGGSGCPADVPDAAFTNYRFAATYGVAPEDIVIERESLDTDDQARILAPLLGQEPFLLVTSASHMPRSMALLKAEGVRGAIPAPADFRTGLYSLYSEAGFTINSLYPNAVALWNSERAVYEYLGLLWMHVRGLF